MNDPLISTLIAIGRDGAERAMDIEVEFCPNLRQYVATRKDWEPGMAIGFADTADGARDELIEDERFRRERAS